MSRYGSSYGHDAQASQATRAWRGFHDDLDVAAEQSQEVHEAFRRETGKPPAQQT